MRMGIKTVAEKGKKESGLRENLPAESPALLQPLLRKSAAKITPPNRTEKAPEERPKDSDIEGYAR